MEKILQVKNLKKYFPIRRGILQKQVGDVKAVDGVSFDVHRGETLGLVGESGCGKTTTGRCLMQLIEPTDGEVLFGEEQIDFCKLTQIELKPYRRRMQMIFQDPYSSLNPRMTVGDIIAEPLYVNQVSNRSETEDRVVNLLESVGLQKDDMRRYPHAFSGGQRQRIGIARALVLKPELIIADEPVSALDVSIQAQILNLLEKLKEEFQLSYIFIAHDLSVVEHISDRIAVMYLGRIVETNTAHNIYRYPKHPYTEALISAVPMPDPEIQKGRKRIRLEGDIPDPSNPPLGCHFHPRCGYAVDVCAQEELQLKPTTSESGVACHRHNELSLQGI